MRKFNDDNKKVKDYDRLQCSDADSLCLAVSEDVSDVNCYCPNGKVIIDDDHGNGGDGNGDIAVTTAINIKGGGGRWERLVYYCGENNLCTPSPREHPSRGVRPSWPVCGEVEALPHPHTPARRDLSPPGRCAGWWKL